MVPDKIIQLVRLLSRREREVLALVCSGLDYAATAERLELAVSTVKEYMGRVYEKFGLKELRHSQRVKMLDAGFCEALEIVLAEERDKQKDQRDKPDDPDDPKPPVPIDIKKMVDDDEKALVAYRASHSPVVIYQPQGQRPEKQTPQAIVIDEPSRPLAFRLRWWLVAAIGVASLSIGVCGTAGAFWAWTQFFSAPSTPVAQVPTSSQAAPSPSVPSTRAPQTVIVVVTATPPPATETPLVHPTDTSVPPSPTTIPSPTQAPIPTDTLPGTKLQPGDTWTQNGVRLTLVNHVLRTFQGKGEIGVQFELANSTGADLTVSLDIRDVTLDTNTGTRFELFNCPDYGKVYQMTFKPSSREVVYICGRDITYFHGDYFAPDVTAVLVTVRNWSRISEAVWELPIIK